MYHGEKKYQTPAIASVGATLPAMAVGLIGSLTGRFWLAPVWFQNPSMLGTIWSLFSPGTSPPAWWNVMVPKWCAAWPMLHGLAVSVVGLIVGGAIVWFVRIAGAWVFRREAMGFGDVILMALIGSFLGWQATVLVFFLARMGVVTAGFLARNTKYAVLIIFIVAAVISPGTDVVSQALMAGPMLGLYGVSIVVAWISAKRKTV